MTSASCGAADSAIDLVKIIPIPTKPASVGQLTDADDSSKNPELDGAGGVDDSEIRTMDAADTTVNHYPQYLSTTSKATAKAVIIV